MSIKTGIGYSPLSGKVYLGKQNTNNRIWVGNKQDITNDFLSVSFEYFEENTIRDIGSSDGSSNLFINVKNDKKGIEKAIKALNKELEKLS